MSKLITISELSKKLGLVKSDKKKPSNYTLRYWEREFKQIKPKIINKRRYYSNDQISTIKFIKTLIKDNGMTIKGVKKILNSQKFDLDDRLNLPINNPNKNLKLRLSKISSILKKLKKDY